MAKKFNLMLGAVSNGWQAPTKLIKNYFDKAFPKPNAYSPVEGGTIDINTVVPMTYRPYAGGKVGWVLPWNYQYPGTKAFVNGPSSWNSTKTYIQHGNYAGGDQDNLDSKEFTPSANYIQAGDCAVVIETKTVKEYKGTALHVTEPVPIMGWDFANVSFSIGEGSLEVNSPGAVSGWYIRTSSSGSFGPDRRGSIKSAYKETNEYDDWIIITNMDLYGRAIGDQNPRKKLSPFADHQRPAVMGTVDMIQSIMQSQQKVWFTPLKSTNIMKYTEDNQKRQIYSMLPMPDVGVPFGSRQKSPCNPSAKAYYGVYGKQYAGIPFSSGLGESVCNVPWAPGYYNQIEWLPNVTNDVGYIYYYTPDISNYDGGKMNGWMTVTGEKSPDYLNECYGAKNILFTGLTDINIPSNAGNAGLLVGATPGADFSGGTYTPVQLFRPDRQALAFPNWEAVVEFFKDWGFLATQDTGEAENNPNDTTPDSPGSGWGDWDPENPPTNPWDNNGNGDKPGVDYDPTNPGVTPLDPDVPLVNPAITSNGYVMNVNTMKKVQEWLCVGNFLADSSNLFVDKMSAFNGATMFPFDVRDHDPQHCVSTPSLIMAGAATQLEDLYKIEGAYNSWVDGGYIEYGTDWLAIRPDFNAYSTSSYTILVPFVGNVQVPASAVIYRKVTLQYAVDLISGAATAVLKSFPTAKYPGVQDKGFVVGMYPCQVGQPIPFVSDNTTQRNFAIAMGALKGAMGGGESGIQSGRNVYESMGGSGTPAQMSGGLQTTKAVPGAGGAGIAAGVGVAVAGVGIGAVKGALGASLANPLEMSHAGSIGSLAAWATGFIPYLTLTSQIPATPNGYAYVMGSQTSQRGQLGNFRANNLNYVECYAAKISIPGATATEMSMVSKALESGVFV